MRGCCSTSRRLDTYYLRGLPVSYMALTNQNSWGAKACAGDVQTHGLPCRGAESFDA